MLDYFFAIGVALAGLVVVYFMFQTISKSEIVAIASSSERKPRSRRSAKPVRRTEDTALDHETEALIAREIARHTTAMRADTRLAQPQTLESMRKEASSKAKGGPRAGPAAGVSEQQILIDKELGFQPVAKQPKQRKNSTQVAQQVSQDEEMGRKLGQFFRNSNRRDKKALRYLNDEQSPSANGAQVFVKKDISNTRTW